MINLNKHRIDFGKGDVGIGVIGNTTDSAQLRRGCGHFLGLSK